MISRFLYFRTEPSIVGFFPARNAVIVESPLVLNVPACLVLDGRIMAEECHRNCFRTSMQYPTIGSVNSLRLIVQAFTPIVNSLPNYGLDVLRS